jgi:PKD repeat protein
MNRKLIIIFILINLIFSNITSAAKINSTTERENFKNKIILEMRTGRWKSPNDTIQRIQWADTKEGWGVAFVQNVDTKTETPFEEAPKIVLGKQNEDNWIIYFPGETNYASAAAQLPLYLLPKSFFFESQNISFAQSVRNAGKLPWTYNQSRQVTQDRQNRATGGSHTPGSSDEWAWDFGLSTDEAVLASRPGIIAHIYTSTPKNTGCLTCDWTTANRIVIDHEDGTATLYMHLSNKAPPVSLLQRVSAGQIIGYADHTGRSGGTHLHFALQPWNSNWNGAVTGTLWYQHSIESLFDDPNVPGGNPTWPNSYKSGNSGSAPPTSCTTTADQITLYANTDFGGACVTLGVGEYASPGALGAVGNDNTRSVRVGSNVQALLCKDDNYNGGCDTFTSDDSNLADNGIGSGTSSVKVQQRPTAPAIPTLNSPSNGATLPADHDLTFAWNGASGASQYLLEWWGGPYSTMQPCGWSTATSCHIGQIGRGYSYSWHIKARNSAGNESAWSDTWSFSTKLSTPANLQAQEVSCSQINLFWTDNVGGEDGFTIFQNGVAIGQASANSTSYQSTGLNPSTEYSYTIKAFKGANMSDASNTATAVTSACAQPPSAEFDAWPQSGQAPLTVAMHIVSTDNISSCAWDYGDGMNGTSCASLHDHVYTNPGSYTVRLRVAGPGGTDDQERSNYITVLAPACDDPFEPDDDTTKLHDFPVGNTETHTFCQANDQDWVALQATAGAIYRIETLNLALGTDTVLELYQSNNSTPIRVDDDGNGGQASLIVWQPTSTDTYYLKVRDYSGTGDPHHTYDLRITASTAPQPPSNMSAGNATETSVSFNWQDNSQDETGFNVYKWGFNGSSWDFYFLAAVGPNVTTFTDTGLSCSSDYFYNVSAYNAIGESSKAGWIKVSTNSCAPPTAAFDASPQTGNAPLTVTMRNNSAGNYTSCLWEYGDGSTGNACDSIHSHIYTNAGSYTVRLTVAGPGGSNTQTRVNYIVVANAPPAAGLSNGGFELDANGDGRPDGWSTNNNFTTSAAAKHGGSYAGRHFAVNNASYTIVQQVSNLQVGKSYSFKAFVNIPATKDSFTFKLVIKWIDAKGKTLRTDTVKSYTKTTGTSNGGWNQATGSYKAPNGVAKAEVQMVVSSLNATVFVDDITFN